MKTLNRFITEKLKITKDTKILLNDNIFDYVWVLLGFNPENKNEDIYKKYIDPIKNWIYEYYVTINDIDETFLCLGDGPISWFNQMKKHVEKYLGKEVADDYVYTGLNYYNIKIFNDHDVTVNNFDRFGIVYNEYGIMFKFRGTDATPAYAYVITLKK